MNRVIFNKLTKSQIAHLKSHEAEASQLRGLVHEQQRALRVASRQIETLRTNEKGLQDDLSKIKTLGCTVRQQQEMEQKYLQKSQVECQKLRMELSSRHEQEQLLRIQEITRDHQKEIMAIKSLFEKEKSHLAQQVNSYIIYTYPLADDFRLNLF